MKFSRWPLIFASIVAALAIVSVALVLTVNSRAPSLLPAGTPDGTLQRYFLALRNGDFETAYNYLSPQAQSTMPSSQWVAPYGTVSNRSSWQATFGKPVINGSNATIEVIIENFNSSGPFNNPINSHTVVFTLQQQYGNWKITSPEYLWGIIY